VAAERRKQGTSPAETPPGHKSSHLSTNYPFRYRKNRHSGNASHSPICYH
jgi:hypothetical protein